MQDWETQLMVRMAEAVSWKHAKVLEIGYGLGISAGLIQQRQPQVHVIIEANSQVAQAARDRLWPADAHAPPYVIEAFWQEVLSEALVEAYAPGGFDGILFDTFPLSPREVRRNHFDFFPHVSSLLRSGGNFTYYSDEAESLSEEHRARLQSAFGDTLVETEIVTVAPPHDCEYWSQRTLLHVVVTKQ